jgi:ADP-glucose pyrophosphorylase
MPDVAALFFDIDLSGKIPGVLPATMPSLFPFWGSYLFIDFVLSNTNFTEASSSYSGLFTQKSGLKQISSYLSLWEGRNIEIQDNGVTKKDFLRLLGSLKCDKVILYNTSSLFLLESAALESLVTRFGGEIVKIAIDAVPVDLYITKRKQLMETIKSFRGPGEGDEPFVSTLFNEILHSNFDDMNELPGIVLFQNNLMQLFESNLLIVSDTIKKQLPYSFKKVSSHDDSDTLITRKGCVKNSFFSPGTKIEGYVEDSVLFPGVQVKENSRIINSVIMNQNQIGRNVVIEKTLLFPVFHETLGTVTVGDQAKIGGCKSKVSNRDNPKQIHSGLTVIGSNPNIPDSAVIEPGSFLEPDLSPSVIRKQKTIKRGSSLYR